MHKRIRSLTLAFSAVAVAALGGSALAGASASEPVGTTDPGPALQQGDQTTPDVATHARKHARKHAQKHANRAAAETQAATDPAGANDTSSPDTSAGAEEISTETPSESGPSDGPGGHEDPAGEVQNDYTGPGEG